MGRRAKGDGSVYQRKDGRLIGEYTDTNGKRRYVSGKSKADVRAKLKEKLRDKDEGIAVDSGNLAFGAYLDQWLESTKETVGLRTYQRAEETVRLHIEPKLGRVRLDKLMALQLDKFYCEKLTEGLSPRSVQIIHAMAHKALKQAAKWKMVRAHQHAAGARRAPSREDSKRGSYPSDEALGRSRGGLSTKLHLACDGRGRGTAHTIPERRDQRKGRQGGRDDRRPSTGRPTGGATWWRDARAGSSSGAGWRRATRSGRAITVRW